LENSLKNTLRKIRPFLAPKNSRRERIARFLLQKLPALRSFLLRDYKKWIRLNEPGENDLKQQCLVSVNFPLQPLISLVTPVYRTSPKVLTQTIESVFAQTYGNWELCIANGDPTDRRVAAVLNNFARRDTRIRVINVEKNLGIAGNTNAAIAEARGEFIAFLDHDDILAPFALFELINALNQFPESDLFYSDEDYITGNGKRRYNPYFKPVLAIDYLRTCNYMPHFLVVRKDVGDQLGWLREGLDGAQDFDLVLRVVEVARWVTHIPQILYHWRALSTSTASAPEAKGYANDAGLRVVQDHLRRVGLNGHVENGPGLTTYHIRYELSRHPLVSIIIPNHNHMCDLKRCITSIEQRSTYKNFEIIIVENNSQEAELLAYYQELQQNDRARVIEYHKLPFNYSEVNNFAVAHARGEILLFLNNDVEVISPDWLERMLEYALRADVGGVGAKLYFPNEIIQHVGVIIGLGGLAGHQYVNYPRSFAGYRYNALLPQNYSAVTAACLMMRRKVFDEINGFDLAYQLAFGDVDLCLRLRDAGYLIVWTPYAELYHHESLTRGYDDKGQKMQRFLREVEFCQKRWQQVLDAGDPYYNPNLALDRGYYSLRPGKCDHTPRSVKGLGYKPKKDE
jgi:O-antigen biosynthesis protein